MECFQIELNVNASIVTTCPNMFSLIKKLFFFNFWIVNITTANVFVTDIDFGIPVSRSRTSETWVWTNRGVRPVEAAELPALAGLEQTSCYCVKNLQVFFNNSSNFNFCRLFGFVKRKPKAKLFSFALLIWRLIFVFIGDGRQRRPIFLK